MTTQQNYSMQHEHSGPASAINVGKNERMLSLAAGVGAILYGLKRRDWVSLGLAAAGMQMVWRAATGSSPIYKLLGINRAVTSKTADVSVPHEQGIRVEQSVMIECSPDKAYQFWRNFENLPRFMHHLDSVTMLDNTRSHWVTKALPGIRAEWDAEIINDVKDKLIAWRSLPHSRVNNAGTVHFEALPDGGTRVRAVLEYAPMGGQVGAAIARLFGENPAYQVAEDLRRFKKLMALSESPASTFSDSVQEASEESFPASDPPGWTASSI